MLPCLYLTQHPPAPATPTPPRQSIQCNILNASEPKRAGSGSGRHRQQEKGKSDDEDVHETKAMLVVRRLSAGVRGRRGCGQGQQKGARRLSITTGSSSANGAGYWGRQYEKAKEAGPVVLAVLGVGAVIWEGSRRLEKLRGEAAGLRAEAEKKEAGLRAELEKQKATYGLELEKNEAGLRAELEKQKATYGLELEKKEAGLRAELEKQKATYGLELEKNEAGLRAELEKQKATYGLELEKKEAGLRAELEKQKATYRLELEKKEAELATRDAVLRGEIANLRGEVKEKDAFLRGEVKEKDALRGGEVDRRILDLLTRGDYDRLLEERANARLAGLPPSPPPHSST